MKIIFGGFFGGEFNFSFNFTTQNNCQKIIFPFYLFQYKISIILYNKNKEY